MQNNLSKFNMKFVNTDGNLCLFFTKWRDLFPLMASIVEAIQSTMAH